MKNTEQLTIRLSLPREMRGTLLTLPPVIRGQVVSALLMGAADGVDLRGLLAGMEQLRRCGVLLNQTVHLAHLGCSLDQAAVKAVVQQIDRLRGRAK